jgi:hypothetical protein
MCGIGAAGARGLVANAKMMRPGIKNEVRFMRLPLPVQQAAERTRDGRWASIEAGQR